MELILALDAGTSGVRTAAFDQRGELVDSSYRELTQYFPGPGLVEHDPGEIADLAVATLGEVARKVQAAGHKILSVGITNQRETTVAFDRANGEILHRAIVWQDKRTSSLCEELEKDGHGDLVRRTTGLVLDSYFSATKMKWLIDNGMLNAATSPALCTIDTWLIWRLCGTYVTEPSNASRTLLMDLETLDWSEPMLRLFSVPREMLPIIQPSRSNFGEILSAVVPELAGVSITGVLGDQQAALFGQACFSTGMVKATYGTGAFILANAGAKNPGVFDGLITTVAWDLGEFDTTAYAVEGSAFVAGAAVQWLRDEMKFTSTASELEPLALSVPDSAGVHFIPAFNGLGSPYWRGDVRGSISGLSQAVTKGNIARALVEALAYQVRAMTDAFDECGLGVKELRCDGGAAAMDLLMQLQATQSKSPVLRSKSLEATSRGAATIAGLGTMWGSLDELANLWEPDKRFEPEDPVFADPAYAAWSRVLMRS
jgi:glycerol kinase